MKEDPYIKPYIKINSKWIKDLNIRLKTIKPLQENIERKVLDISFGDFFFFLDLTSKTQATKPKIEK